MPKKEKKLSKYKSEICFLCSCNDGTTKEHIIPQWLQQRFNLQKSNLKLPNGTNITYDKLVFPACAPCNNVVFGQLENKIKEAHISLPTESEVWLWAIKIVYGLNCKDKILELDIKNPGRKIADEYGTVDELQKTKRFLGCISGRFKTTSDPFGSVFIFKFEQSQKFHFCDLYATKSMFICIGKVAFIVFIEDGQFVKNSFIDKYNELKNKKLTLDLVMFFYASTHLFMQKHLPCSHAISFGPGIMLTDSISKGFIHSFGVSNLEKAGNPSIQSERNALANYCHYLGVNITSVLPFLTNYRPQKPYTQPIIAIMTVNDAGETNVERIPIGIPSKLSKEGLSTEFENGVSIDAESFFSEISSYANEDFKEPPPFAIDEFYTELHEFGITRQLVQGDGACQFRSIHDALKLLNTPADGVEPQLFASDEAAVSALREAVVEHINDPVNRTRFSAALANDTYGGQAHQDIAYASLEDYLTDMSKPTTYGDHLTLQALSEITGRSIVVINPTVDPNQFVRINIVRPTDNTYFNANNALILIFNGVDHYDVSSTRGNDSFSHIVYAALPVQIYTLVTSVQTLFRGRRAKEELRILRECAAKK